MLTIEQKRKGSIHKGTILRKFIFSMYPKNVTSLIKVVRSRKLDLRQK